MTANEQAAVGGETTTSGEGRRGWSRAARVVIALGALYAALTAALGDRSTSSVLWPLDGLLMLLFVGGLWWSSRHPATKWRLAGGWAALAFVGGSWLTGMLYELNLRTGPTGFGGMHPDTATSFLLAQGYYVPFALGGWLLARRYGYSAEDVFWAGALSSLYELITVGVARTLAQPDLLLFAPLMGGYYLTVYGYILALPLLFLDERGLWGRAPRAIGRGRKVLYGLLLGPVCWALFLAWVALVL